MEILKAIRNRSKSGSVSQPPERLLESWEEDDEAIREGVPFFVKYLGSVLVNCPFGDEVSSDAVKNVVCMAKASGKQKLERVEVTVSLKGISVKSLTVPEHKFDTSIYRISHCSADGHFNHVFSYLATNKNETIECHAFLCPKRKLAEAIALTVAKAFNLAFEIWEASRSSNHSKSKVEDHEEKSTEGISEKQDSLEGILDFGLGSRGEAVTKLQATASKCDLISWSSVAAFDDDVTTLHKNFSRIADTPRHPLREAKDITRKVSAVNLKRLAAAEPLAGRAESPTLQDDDVFYNRERHDSGSGIFFSTFS